MENQKRFDLEQSLNQWRSTLENSPAIRSTDMEELEAHLRDSIQMLQSKGLGVEEAFLIGCRRLGPSRQLDREYGKMNQRQVWLDRIMWLAVGLMLYLWIRPIASSISMRVFEYCLIWKIGVQWSCFLYVTCAVLAHTAAWLLILRKLTRYSKAAAGWVQYCLRNPLLPLLGILALNLNQGRVMDWLLHFLEPNLEVTSADAAILNSWQTWGSIVTDVGYLLVFAYLLQRYLRALDETLPKPVLVSASSSPDILVLENEGLSNLEKSFLVQHRRGRDSSGIQMDAACLSRLWTGRTAWMLAAAMFFNCVALPIQDAANLITLEIASWFPVNGHLLGGIGILLQSAAFLSLEVVAWKETTRPKNVFSRFAQIIVKRPLITTFGFLFLTIVTAWGLFLGLWVFSVAFPITLQENVSVALSEWHRYGLQFWLDVLPVLFVFWLGRQRLNLTVKELFAFRRN